jgi:hypothetical protein
MHDNCSWGIGAYVGRAWHEGKHFKKCGGDSQTLICDQSVFYNQKSRPYFSSDFMISSPLMNESYDPLLKDYTD